MNKLECFKPSTYDWSPSYGSATSSYVRVVLTKLNSSSGWCGWRVLVSGIDDLMMERDYEDDQLEDALKMYLLIQTWRTVEPEELKREGFQFG